ncbi:hypothetical protein DOY81_007730 [Sarcophaga bullata]|nr:hypothetical protein DOY81_007730 [Sarcophaga bullata]
MSNHTSDMPPLPTAETLAGVTTQQSTSQPPTAAGSSTSGSGSGGGTGAVTVDSTQSSSDNDTTTAHQHVNNNSATTTTGTTNTTNTTISAAADSSDNQPATPQPPTQLLNNSNTDTHQQQQQQQQQNVNSNSLTVNHHPYANHHIYANHNSNVNTSSSANSYNAQVVYSNSNMDMQQQQQQQQHQLQQQQQMPHGNYTTYLNSYEQFYQHQQQNQHHPSQSAAQMDYINSNSTNPGLYANASDYNKQQQQQQQTPIVRYHPYLHNPTSQTPAAASLDLNSQSAPPAVSSTAASSTVMSPRVVSSTSPSSSSNQIPLAGVSGGVGGIGGCSNSSMGSPSNTNSNSLQCKKCGIMCTNDADLQEHITNVHGASPYGSSGYASSPYIKDELQQQTPPAQSQQQQQQQHQQQQSSASNSAANPTDLLDLDAQKMLYPTPPVANNNTNNLMHQPMSSMAADPLHNLHTMQQRAGLTNWDQQQQQQQQEGLPPYLQHPHSVQTTNYSTPKHGNYHVVSSNSSNIMKTEYPLIKAEYPLADGQQTNYMTASDKTFDPTASGGGQQQQQQMMPPAVPSSPAEFPSTTTGGPQENGGGQTGASQQQQYRAGNFEPPSSSSTAVPTTGSVAGKAANWKSNEARRPKTYNCTACNKWFTSSGHLKRHYNTTLHKNAVKSSGQPDPATLPISVHHHPARDPSAKPSRRAAAAAAAAAAANSSQGNVNHQQQHQHQQQQQPPNPVQPPEPPNSPREYAGGPQMAAGGLAPLTHYTATPSPNSMYQHQQHQYHQHQYQMQQQLQSPTANVSSLQHTSAMTGGHHHHYNQPQHQQQQQTVMNGHPNGLAGLSVPTTSLAQQQMPTMPSSQMRGLLNNTVPTALVAHTIKNNNKELMEAATSAERPSGVQRQLITLTPAQVHQQNLEEDEEIVQELVYLTTHTQVKQEVLSPRTIYTPKHEEQQQQQLVEAQRLPIQPERAASVVVLREVDRNVEHHRTTVYNHHQQQQQPEPYQLLVEQQQRDLERLYHTSTPNSTHSSTQARSPITTCHQTYQLEQLQQPAHLQMVVPDTYMLTQTPPPQQPQLHNIMEQQRFISMRLPTSITQQQPNSMLQLQLQDTTIRTTRTTLTNTVSTLPPSHPVMQLPQQQPHTELQPLHNIPLQQQQQLQDTSNTNIPHMLPQSLTTTTNNSIPCFHHLQHPVSALPPLDHTLIYPPRTTIGNTELITLDAYGNLVSATPGQTGQQIVQTTDGQFLQLITTNAPNASESATTLFSSQNYNPAYVVTQGSPHSTTDTISPLPSHYQFQDNSTSSTLTALSCGTSYSPNLPTTGYDSPNKGHATPPPTQIKQQTNTSMDSVPSTSGNKRKRNSSSSSSVSASNTILPSGRIKCLPCDKEFTKVCYLTQHNKSFHSGEYPFRCQKCGKRYQAEEAYTIHLAKHKTTDKAHKCDLCPKQFHHKTDLRRHIEAIHTGNKQHSCEICAKSFCRKDHLRKHLETHNRPRVVAKKLSNKGKNKAANTTVVLNASAVFAEIGKRLTNGEHHLQQLQQIKQEDIPPGNSALQLQAQPQSQSQPQIHSPENNGQQGQDHNVNKTSPMSSTTHSTTPSPTMQIHLDDVAADDEDLLDEDELECYGSHDMGEGQGGEYAYEQHAQQQEQQSQGPQQHQMQMQIIAQPYTGDMGGSNNNSGSVSSSSMGIYNIVESEMAIY